MIPDRHRSALKAELLLEERAVDVVAVAAERTAPPVAGLFVEGKRLGGCNACLEPRHREPAPAHLVLEGVENAAADAGAPIQRLDVDALDLRVDAVVGHALERAAADLLDEVEGAHGEGVGSVRSEEHTSELQSRENLVC